MLEETEGAVHTSMAFLLADRAPPNVRSHKKKFFIGMVTDLEFCYYTRTNLNLKLYLVQVKKNYISQYYIGVIYRDYVINIG